MVSPDTQFLATIAGTNTANAKDAHRWFEDAGLGQKALYRLEQAGLLFPIARGRYAVPGPDALKDTLAVRSPPVRVATWLPAWIAQAQNRTRLAAGLDWKDARFLGAAVHTRTDLVWDGPLLLVPIQEGASHLTGLHHRVPVFAYDAADDAETATLPNNADVRVPPDRELARVLVAHSDPRIREAGRKLMDAAADGPTMQAVLLRTEPPDPFPDPKTRLPRGPPFRYRLFAPQSWVRRDLRHRRPIADDTGGDPVG